jgi:phosphatidylglycerophosphate synthase
MTAMAQVRATAKARDAWWTVLLVDPLALRLVQWSAQRRWVTPNRLTVAAFVLTLAAATAFAQGTRWWLVAGALAYHVGFVLDCSDGKLARLRGTSSIIGQWLDFMLDRLGVTICAVALFAAQYGRTHRAVALVVGTVVIFLNLFHQINGQVIEGALRQAQPTPEREATAATAGASEATGAVGRLRIVLARHRIRADVFSAIEFQMAIFVVGPLLGLVVPVAAAACPLLLLFDLALVAKFIRAARSPSRIDTA